jgi:hypothetical protein
MKSKINIEKIIDDPKISYLDSTFSLAEVRAGYKYAHRQFNKQLERLTFVERQYQDALEAGDSVLAAEKDKEFYKTAAIIEFYSDESERLIRLWSKKTGCPCFISGSDGMEVHDPKSGESVLMPKSVISEVECALGLTS